MSLWSKLLNLLFPPRCVFCGRLMENGQVCKTCEDHLPKIEGSHAVFRGTFGRCAVAFWYEDTVRDGIHGLKFSGRRGAAPVFAAYLAETVALHFAGEFDAVTYVPVSPRRLRSRGYDQSRLLAEEMAGLWDTEAVTALKKVRENRVQSTITAPEERRANVLGAYRAADEKLVAGKRFLLVDDVLTTGSTMAACRDTLLMAGASSVVCAALAIPRKKVGKGAENGDH